jgi:hypothetical protein
MAVRQRAKTVGNTGRVVHLAVLPSRSASGLISTLCGALLAMEQTEVTDLGSGMPCSMCLILRAATEKPVTPVGGLPLAGPTPTHRRASPEGYAALGWPVTVRGDQVLLTLDGDVTALILPVSLAEQVVHVLIAQARPIPVLTHPDTPEHRILIAGEPYGIPLPWPDEVRVATGHLPLPPTVSPRGTVTWAHLPDGHPLSFCREIDLLGAVHTALRPVSRRSGADHRSPPGSGLI